MFENITMEMLSVWGGCIIFCIPFKKVFFKEKTWIDVLVIMFFSMFVMLLVAMGLNQIIELHWFIYVVIGLCYPPFIRSFFDWLNDYD